MGTKQNPGNFDCYTKAADDEPIFTLRANDPIAPMIVRYWIYKTYTDTELDLGDNPKAQEAFKCAVAMENWRKNKIFNDTKDSEY